jgi:hypothetical protein
MLQSGQLQSIGNGRIDKWFLETADLNQAHLMTAVADPRETLIVWQFVSKNSQSGKPDMMLVYNYSSGEWTTADATTHFIFNAVSLPWTVDQLDQFVALDNVPASFDDPVWSGGKALLFGLSDTGKVYSFSGPTLPLSVETGEYQLSRLLANETGADIARVDATRPLFEGAGVSRVQVGTRALPNGDMNWSEQKEAHPETGFSYHRSQARFQRFRVTIDGEWRKMFGLQVDARPVGRR